MCESVMGTYSCMLLRVYVYSLPSLPLVSEIISVLDASLVGSKENH